MRATYIQKGDTLDYKNTTDTPIEAGEVVGFGNRVGVAGTVIRDGETGSLHMTGVFKLPKKTGESIALGADVFYTADGITAVAGASKAPTPASADGNSKIGTAKAGEAIVAADEPVVVTAPVGYAVAAAAVDDTFVIVKIG